jgi:hypothetical protein
MKKKQILNVDKAIMFEKGNNHSSFTIYRFIFTTLKLRIQCQL